MPAIQHNPRHWHAEDGPPITQRTSGLERARRVTGATQLRIIRAILTGEQDSAVLSSLRDNPPHVRQSRRQRTGLPTKLLFAVEHAFALYDRYQLRRGVIAYAGRNMYANHRVLGEAIRRSKVPAFMDLRDVGLFLRSARTDAQIRRLQSTLGTAAAMEAVYALDPDPWASAAPRYRYQRRKYEVLASLLPRRFRRALDLGCGVGLLSRHLAARADTVVGMDVAPSAVARARVLHADKPNVRFEAHDLLDLPRSLDGSFDLVAIVDVLYYLAPLDDSLLQAIAARVSGLLTPGGTCMLANHYFCWADPASRRSRRIHDAFAWSPCFTWLAEHRRPFYLATLLHTAEAPAAGAG